MTFAALPPPTWVNTPAKLNALAALLMKQPSISVDTESNSLHAYREQVCLIQFSIPTCDYIVDPLELHDLSPLAEVFSMESIEKIFHAAEYDVICLQRDFHFVFNNIFDTMIAARTLGYSQVGLGNLLAEKFGLEVDKRFQKANWAQRPLPNSQLQYACLDTHYLLELRNQFEIELKQKERYDLALEDFARVCTPPPPNGKSQRAGWERISGHINLSPSELAILNELCLCRERLAEKLDRPVFKVMGDQLLLSLAETAPANRQDLGGAGMTKLQIERFGEQVLRAIQRGKESSPIVRSKSERLPDSVLLRVEKLKKWRKIRAEKMSVESDVILPKIYLHPLAEANPRTLESLEKVMADAPCRAKMFGGEILAALGVKANGDG